MQPKTLFLSVFLLSSACATHSTNPGVASPSERDTASVANDEARPHGHPHGNGAAMNHDKQSMQRMHEQHCPLKVEGTKVAAADVEGAVALDFETTTDVAELQRRVARMAEQHAGEGCAMMSHAGGMAHAEGHPPGHAALHLASPAPSSASAESSASPSAPGPVANEHQLMHSATVSAQNTERGARLVFTPKQAEQLDALRAVVRAKAEKMSTGSCAMHDAHAH